MFKRICSQVTPIAQKTYVIIDQSTQIVLQNDIQTKTIKIDYYHKLHIMDQCYQKHQ